MRSRIFFALKGTIIVATMGMLGWGASTGAPAGAIVGIGLLPTMFRHGNTNAFDLIRKPLSSLVERQSGLNNQLRLLPDTDAMRQELESGRLQFGLCHGFELAWMKQKDPKLRALMCAAPAHQPLQAVMIVADNSPIKEVCDLRGKRVAVPNGIHEVARLFAERGILCSGQNPWKFASEVAVPKNPESALHEVYEDKVQAAVVDAGAWQLFSHRYPARFRRLRVLTESEPFPLAAFIYRDGDVDPQVLRRFKDGMLTARRSIFGRQLMGLMHCAGFEPIPSDYAEQLTSVLKRYPPADDK